MNADQFLSEFSHIANAPGGIARLRQLVLQLAISGRLVARGTPETPVASSLEEIALERRLFERDFSLRAQRRYQPLTTSPFVIPAHWQWVQLDDLALYIQRGKSPKYADSGSVRVVSQKSVQWAGFDLGVARWISESSVSGYGPERFLRDGDLLWNSTGTGTAGRMAIFRQGTTEQVVADSHMTVIRVAHALPSYIWCVVASPWVQSRIRPDHPESLVSGSTQQVELAASTARRLAIPCPPVEEQIRIVAKVDDLMALCDQLDSQQQERRKFQTTLRNSILRGTVNSPKEEFGVNADRLIHNFSHLFSLSDDVRELRDAIFDLGLRGLLLPTSRNTDAADSVDAQIHHPRPLPEGWRWKTISDLCEYITSGSRGWKAFVSRSGDRFIRSQDIKNDVLFFDNPAYVALPERAEGKRTLVQEGDILLTITGANVGKCAIAPKLSGRAYVSQHVALVRLEDPSLSEFIHLWMINAFGGRDFLSRYIYGDKPGLNLTQVGSVPIPVPPDNVLPHVLASLRSLQALIDRLAEQLSSKQAMATALAAAAIADLTGIATEPEVDTTVRAPQIELVAPVRLGRSPDVKLQAPLAALLARHEGEMSARDLWQRFGGEIDAFYAQLKEEVLNGWIAEPAVAEVRERPLDMVSAQ